METEIGNLWNAAPLQQAAVAEEPPLVVESFFGVGTMTYVERGLLVQARLPVGAGPGRASTLGQLGVLVDTAAGRAVRTQLPASHTVRTANLRLDAGNVQLRAGATVTASAEVLDLGSVHALSRVVVVDEQGLVVGRATGRFVVVDAAPPRAADPAPALLEAQPTEVDAALGGFTVQQEGDLYVAVVRPVQWLANQNGVMHGGAQVAVAEVVLRRIAEFATSMPVMKALDLTVRFLRAVPVDEQALRFEVIVEKAGRLLTVARLRAHDPANRLLLTAEATLSG